MERFDESGNQSTYLSTYVKNLVCHQSDSINESSYLNNLISTSNGLFDWSAIELCDIVQSCSQDCEINYEQAVFKLYSLSVVIHNHLIQYTTEIFCDHYEPYLNWTHKKHHLLSCFDLLKSNAAGHIEAALLLLTSCTEQILGDIYLTCSTHNTQCPSRLTDLLATAELRMALGNNLIFCLKCYIASPLGLNLRNLAWHGFQSKHELQSRHISFILMCVLSFCEVTKNNLTTEMELKQRCLITYNATSAVLLENYFPCLHPEQLRTLFKSCTFVTKSMDYMWYLAVEWYEQGRFGDAVMILLPQLEHSLRRVFCCSNNLEERLQTAESSELYTTFNEIFALVLSNTTANKFQETIGKHFMEILLDLFVHQEGPRLRDHISHGEVDLRTFPKYLITHVFSVSVAFCVAFSREKLTLLENDYYLQAIMKAVEKYSSFFHPLSCLKRTFLSYITSLNEWRQIPKPCDEDLLISTSNIEDNKSNCRQVLEDILRSNIPAFETRGLEDIEVFYAEILQFVTEVNLPTLFRPRNELETITLLRNIIKHSLNASDKIKDTAQQRFSDWKDKRLRSRQRNTYQRLLSNIAFINHTMNHVVLIVLIEITNIDNISRDHHRKIKFLKRCLQSTENLCTLSSKNKWLECSNFGKLLIHQTESYFQS